jgi:hypothetical protein
MKNLTSFTFYTFASSIVFTLVLSLVFSAVFTFSIPALSKTKRLPTNLTPDQQEPIDVVVPHNQFELQEYAVPVTNKTTKKFEVQASSWTPSDMTGNGYVDQAGGFQSDGAQVSLNFWDGGWDVSNSTISPKLGISFDQLKRTGRFPVLGAEQTLTQLMNLYSARIGAELAPQADLWGHLQPYFSLSILPTWAQTVGSTYSDGENHIYIAAEEVAGLAWRSPSLASFIGVRNLGIEIGVQGTQGLGSHLSGFGVLAGTRLEL